jgi:hypothetical protein
METRLCVTCWERTLACTLAVPFALISSLIASKPWASPADATSTRGMCGRRRHAGQRCIIRVSMARLAHNLGPDHQDVQKNEAALGSGRSCKPTYKVWATSNRTLDGLLTRIPGGVLRHEDDVEGRNTRSTTETPYINRNITTINDSYRKRCPHAKHVREVSEGDYEHETKNIIMNCMSSRCRSAATRALACHILGSQP